MKTKISWYYWKTISNELKRTKLKLTVKNKTTVKEYLIDKIICKTPCSSRTRKRNPVIVMETTAKSVNFETVKRDGYKQVIAIVK